MLCSAHMGRAGLGSPHRAGRAASPGRFHTWTNGCCSAVRGCVTALLLSTNSEYTTVLSATEQRCYSVQEGANDCYCHQSHHH